VAGGMAGQLFVRSLDRADRVYNAMVARGYRGQLLTMTPHHMTPRDWQTAGMLVLLLITIQLLGLFRIA
jgi:cobalt/nickel transport system permease protein